MNRRRYLWGFPFYGALPACNAPMRSRAWAAGYRCGKYVMSLAAYGIKLEE